MITEDYVNFEIAKLLKEKGFDGEVHRSYLVNDNCFAPADVNELPYRKDAIRIPTQQMAMKWLREEHKLWYEISWEGKNAWFVNIFSLDEEQYVMFNKMHNVPSYEEACEAAIKYCLENLI